MNVVFNDKKSNILNYQKNKMQRHFCVRLVLIVFSVIVPVLLVYNSVISLQSKGFRFWVILVTILLSIFWIIFINKTFLRISLKCISFFIPKYILETKIVINENRFHYSNKDDELHLNHIDDFHVENGYIYISADSKYTLLIPNDVLKKDERDTFLYYLSRLKKKTN